MIFFQPSLKHQHIPQVILPIALARQMFSPLAPNRRWIKKTFL
jgi:hypothetical protein